MILCTQKRYFLFYTFSLKKKKRVLLLAIAHAQTKPEQRLEQFGAMFLKDKVTHTKGGEHEFRAAHMDSLLYFHRQKYCTNFAATKCRHAAPRVWIRSLRRSGSRNWYPKLQKIVLMYPLLRSLMGVPWYM